MAAATLSKSIRTAELSDVLGDPLRAASLMPLGPLLALIDMACGRCAATFSMASVVTGCFDEFILLRAPRHGDVVCVNADVVAVGRSSVLVRAVVKVDLIQKNGIRTDILAKSLSTFVAIDPEARKATKIDVQLSEQVEFDTARGKIRADDLLSEFKTARKAMYSYDLRTLEGMADTRVSFSALLHRCPLRQVHVADTRIVIRKQYLPRNLNHGGVIFGGDILETFDAVAVSCARRAALGAAQFVTVAIKGLSFLKPVEMIKVLQVEAKVVACSARFMGVVVRSFVDDMHDGTAMVPAHTGVFHMAAVEENGEPATIDDVGVMHVNENNDKNLEDFYRVMALPLPEMVKLAWTAQPDAYPAADFVVY